MHPTPAKFNELVKKLREIFQIDKPELDFGIYRILNARAGEINDYLQNRLYAKVQEALASGQHVNQEQLARELKEKVEQYTADGVNPDNVPRVKELRQKIAAYSNGTSEHQDAVFSHLLTFFSRYYDNGDFISQRRYKGDTYAIPYAGEEVMLHWANKDQYYTKSGENFSNYSFKLDDGQGNLRLVHFRLVSADTAKDNRKDNDKERRFVLIDRQTVTRIDDDGEEYQEELLPVEMINSPSIDDTQQANRESELIIRFEYKAMPKGTKQDALTAQAIKTVLADEVVKTSWLDLAQRAPTEKNPQRTLLEKHLNTYTEKNTADYFIHKDLGGFLKRELDFYIKNEVMHLDDVQNAEKFADIEKSLRMIQCLRAIALEVISFLAQIENFQKKLWLKKKFVVSADYCITLDRVPESLYSKIVLNEKQWNQWQVLGLWSVNTSGTINDIKANQNWMLDTSLFDTDFKAELQSVTEKLDENTNGLLVHSDNFQGLNLLQAKYNEKIKAIYIDPPYNTDAGPISYKNGYRSSSWVSLMDSRIKKGRELLCLDGVLTATIDDYQYRELNFVIEENFGKDNIAGTVVIRMNPSGRPLPQGFAQSHEYAIFAKKSPQSIISSLPRSEKQNARYKHEDEDGKMYMWELFRKRGSNSERKDRPSLYYPIYIANDQMRIPKMEYDDVQKTWLVNEEPKDFETVVFPIDDNGVYRTWRGQPAALRNNPNNYKYKIENDVVTIYYKFRPDSEGVLPLTNWIDAKYSATEHGTGYLKHFFSEYNVFSYPKSIYAVEDCLRVSGVTSDSIVLDYFAGSGTTAHAVINLNREDQGTRKYILIEQGEYFDSVIKPRIQKASFSSSWKDGKPTAPETGISHAFKVLKLESYEDTLNNLELRRTNEQGDLLNSLSEKERDDYLLHYMLDVEGRGSLLSVDMFKKPFDVSLKVAVDSAGASEVRKIDMVETFNYLIGLTVNKMHLATDAGYARIEGTLPSGETALILWRDCERIDYEELMRLAPEFGLDGKDRAYDVIYVNGDHNIPSSFTETEADGGTTRNLKLRQIEPEFLNRMFSTEDV